MRIRSEPSPWSEPPGPDAARVVQVKMWLLGISPIPMVWRRLLVLDTEERWCAGDAARLGALDDAGAATSPLGVGSRQYVTNAPRPSR